VGFFFHVTSFRTWLVRVDSKHSREHLADLAFGGLKREPKQRSFLEKAQSDLSELKAKD